MPTAHTLQSPEHPQINLLVAARFETPTFDGPGRGLACSATKFCKLRMASNDNGAIWIPKTSIRFGSLDFVVNKEGEMTRVPETLTHLTNDLPDVVGRLGDLWLDPLRKSMDLKTRQKPPMPRSWGYWTPSGTHSWTSSYQGQRTDSHPCPTKQAATLDMSASHPTRRGIISPAQEA